MKRKMLLVKATTNAIKKNKVLFDPDFTRDRG